MGAIPTGSPARVALSTRTQRAYRTDGSVFAIGGPQTLSRLGHPWPASKRSPPICDKVPTRLRGNTVSTLRQWSVEALDGLVWPKYSAAIHALVRIRAASEG